MLGQKLEIEAEWPNLHESYRQAYIVVEVTHALAELSGEYAGTVALCGCDSVQLAAARTLQESAGEAVQFACFDVRLGKAARMLGMSGFT